VWNLPNKRLAVLYSLHTPCAEESIETILGWHLVPADRRRLNSLAEDIADSVPDGIFLERCIDTLARAATRAM
jgi:hypothetical protein